MCQCERQSNAWPSSPLYRTVGFTRIAWLLQQNWWISAALPLNTARGPAAIARGLSGARDCFWLVIECPINNNHSNQCLFSVPWLRTLERGHLKEQWVIECPIISNYSATGLTGFRTVPVYILRFSSLNQSIIWSWILLAVRARAVLLHIETLKRHSLAVCALAPYYLCTEKKRKISLDRSFYTQLAGLVSNVLKLIY